MGLWSLKVLVKKRVDVMIEREKEIERKIGKGKEKEKADVKCLQAMSWERKGRDRKAIREREMSRSRRKEGEDEIIRYACI